DRTFVPGQGNNVYVFPAIGMAVYATGARRVTDEMFIAAASGVAEQVTPSDIAVGLVYPPVFGILGTELRVAARVAEVIFEGGLARAERPRDILAFTREKARIPRYRSLLESWLALLPHAWGSRSRFSKMWSSPTCCCPKAF